MIAADHQHGPLPVQSCTDEILDLCARAMPDESLTVDDLEAVLFRVRDRLDRSGSADGSSPLETPLVEARAAMVVAMTEGDRPVAVAGATTSVIGEHVAAHIQLVVVDPARRRRGLARRLVDRIGQWATEQGASSLTVGAGAPFFLFTGVDSRWTDALCFFETLGFERVGTELDLVCPTTTRWARGATDPTVTTAHVQDEGEATELGAWVRTNYPHWAAEFDSAADAGTVVLARRGAELVGAAAHSVSRWGVIGPVAVDPAAQGQGVGTELISAVLADLAGSGLRQAEIAWTSTVRFYAVACSARVGRCSVLLRKELAVAPPTGRVACGE